MPSYLLYGVSFVFFIIATILYATRTLWLPHLPHSLSSLPTTLSTLPLPFLRHRYTPLRGNTSFSLDAAAGLHSSTFDLSSNIESGDSRQGLDERGKQEVLRMMKARGLGFDDARTMVVMERFRREGIGEDGRPKDPKFVSFS